ncbi:hypothetical protein H4R21_007190 [Coemansia helicoidea]|nr:hypothetical protein H4R21_007190 [Coemansia helicoidea]
MGVPNPMLTSAAVAAAAAAMANGYHAVSGSPYGYPAVSLLQAQHQQQQLYQPLRPAATPSPPGVGLAARGSAAAVGAASHHSISSSSHASPIPSPGATASGAEQTAVPRDALSFLHQPIHQLHKQVAGDPVCSASPPQTGAIKHATNIVSDQ